MIKINNILRSQFLEFYRQTLNLKVLSEKLLHYLPEGIREHCSVSHFNQGCLMLAVDDPVWASQLRYLLPQLRDQLRAEGIYPLSSIKIITTIPQVRPPRHSSNKKHLLSEKAREVIIEASEICEYEPLKAALKRLGRAHI